MGVALRANWYVSCLFGMNMKKLISAFACSVMLVASQGCATDVSDDVNVDDDLGVVEGEVNFACKWTDNGKKFDVTLKDAAQAAGTACVVAGGVSVVAGVGGAGAGCVAGANAAAREALKSKAIYYAFKLVCGGTNKNRYQPDGTGCYYTGNGRSKICP